MQAKRLVLVVAMVFSGAALADDDQGACGIPSNVISNVQSKLATVVTANNGAIFGQFLSGPNRMWSAVVDRQGVLCSVIKTGDAWPGSRAIAMAKASTANDFSNDALALSTANLYAATQPGGSLYGLNNSNPFNPAFLAQGSGLNKVASGIITFGGGVPLYYNGKVIGGLGLSGDSACADHTIAYRMRALAGLAPPASVAGVGLNGTDNILYAPQNTTPTGFEHPHCFPFDVTT